MRIPAESLIVTGNIRTISGAGGVMGPRSIDGFALRRQSGAGGHRGVAEGELTVCGLVMGVLS